MLPGRADVEMVLLLEWEVCMQERILQYLEK